MVEKSTKDIRKSANKELFHAVDAVNLNPHMKDAFFQKVFESEERKKRLVAFLDGIEAKELQIAQVVPIIFGSKENDLSFLCNQIYYYMIEQQSSANPNMPYRMLEYITAGLRTLIENKEQVYRSTELKFSVPKLFTLFTGCKTQVPEQIEGEQRLSQRYLTEVSNPDLEVVVHTYDLRMTPEEVLNYIELEQIPKRFLPYQEGDMVWYGIFANCATYLERAGKTKLKMPSKIKDVKGLCQLFLERGIFPDLFERKEVCEMAVVQYSRDEQLKWTGREEGIEIGREEGREEGIREMVLKMYDAGIELSKIGIIAGISKEQLMEILQEQ